MLVNKTRIHNFSGFGIVKHNTRQKQFLFLSLVVLTYLFGWSAAANAATYTVNTTADTDDGVCNAANCTLREAINAVNASFVSDVINFNIPGGGVKTITLNGTLPVVSDPV